MTRAEHLNWAKERAREYLDAGDVTNAWASMVSDMSKHDETKDHAAIILGMSLLMAGHNQDVPSMRSFIDGFN